MNEPRLQYFIGLDPGLSGAYAVLDQNLDLVTADVLPIALSTHGDKDLDTRALVMLLHPYREAACFAVEKVGARPEDRKTSIFTFGRQTGKLIAVVELFDRPYTEVSPQTWKAKILKGTDKSKEAACGYAKHRWPKIDLRPGPRSKKPHDGIAEAACIAEYCAYFWRGQHHEP